MTKGSIFPLKLRKMVGNAQGKKNLKTQEIFILYLPGNESSNILVLWRSLFYLFSTINICTFLLSLNLSLSSLPVCGFFLCFSCHSFFFCFTSMYRLPVYFWGKPISCARLLILNLLLPLPHPFPLPFPLSFLPLFPSSIWSFTHYFR